MPISVNENEPNLGLNSELCTIEPFQKKSSNISIQLTGLKLASTVAIRQLTTKELQNICASHLTSLNCICEQLITKRKRF